MLADQKSLDLRTLLENARAGGGVSNRDIIRYRREAELNVGSDEHLYRVEWVRYSRCRALFCFILIYGGASQDQPSKRMRVQLLGADDASIEAQGEGGVDRWREYVDSYLLTHPTEWMPEGEDERTGVYLRRCICYPSRHMGVADLSL